MVKPHVRKAAKQAIGTYFAFAKRFPHNAKSFVHSAHRVSLRYKIPFDKEQKALYCKKCGNFLYGKQVRVRVKHGKITRTCLVCKTQKRTLT